MLLQLLDILRMVIVGVAFYFGYSAGFAGEVYDPQAQLQIMIPVVITAIAGVSGLEGLLWGRKSARAKGYEEGSNYQKQSAFALLAITFGALWVHFADWGMHASLTVLFVFFFFFTLSALNHGLEAIRHHNYTWQHVNRPFVLLLMLAGFVYPVMMMLKVL